MESLKCPQCGKPMVEVEDTARYSFNGVWLTYTFKAMQCETHPKFTYQTESQLSESLEIIGKLKAGIPVYNG